MEQTVIIVPEDIQARYQKLYIEMRKYIWNLDVVERLAELEVAIYHKFPDKADMQSKLGLLNESIHDTYSELSQSDDEEFQKAYDLLESIINDYDDTIGCEIYSVMEIPYDIDTELDADYSDADTESVSSDKHK